MAKKRRKRRHKRRLLVVALVGGVAAGAALFVGGALAARDAGEEDESRAATTSTTAAPTTTTSTTVAPTTTTTAPAAADGTLEAGEKGTEVGALQARLSDLGFWLGTPDSSYGQLTRQAVMAFQKAQGLGRDGVAGPATLAALDTATRPTPRDPSGSHIEIDLDRQILLVVQDGQVRWVLNTSTGNGEAYAAPGGGTAVATTPRGSFAVEREIDGLREAPLGTLYRPKYFHGGIAIHGAGQIPAHPASHGCARVTKCGDGPALVVRRHQPRHPGGRLLVSEHGERTMSQLLCPARSAERSLSASRRVRQWPVVTPPRGTPVVVVVWPPSPRGAEARGRAVPSAVPRQDLRPMTTPEPSLPDVELVELARRGDREAFDELIRRHDDRLRGLAYRLLTDRHGMDDALQDAYLKAYRALDRFRAGSDFGTWLYRIAYNSCIDELRRRKRSPVAADDPVDPVSSQPGPDRVVSASETVRAALAELPTDQRVTVVLVDGEGFDHREVAKILGVAPGTVASRLHRARAALRRLLGEEVEQP